MLVIYAYKTVKLIEWVYKQTPQKTVFVQLDGRNVRLYDRITIPVRYMSMRMAEAGSVEW
jgi:hypothetical protein